MRSPGVFLVVLVVAAVSWSEVLPELVRDLELKSNAGPVDVIIGLDLPEVPLSRLSGPAAAVRKAEIEDLQERVMADLEGLDSRLVRRFDRIPFLAMKVDRAALDHLSSHPEVSSLEEDDVAFITLDVTVPLIHADEVQGWGYDGLGEAVAVLDTGIDTSHPWMTGRTIAEACFSSDEPENNLTSLCPNGLTTQFGPGSGINPSATITGYDHGTHVAGIALQSQFAYNGVAPAASLIAIQVFAKEEDQVDCGGFPAPCAITRRSNYLAGLLHVADLAGPPDNLSIASVNMSLGSSMGFGGPCDVVFPSLAAAVADLKTAGITTVSSSGNSGSETSIGSPACLTDVVSVAGTDDNDDIAWFSNTSLDLSVFAPGEDVLAALVGGGVIEYGGTSMASPHVAGAVALLRQADPNATVDEIRDALESTGVQIELPGVPGVTRSRIRVDCAVADLIGVEDPTGLTATDGVFPDRIELSWDPDFRIDRWDVYYSSTDDSGSAQHIGFTNLPAMSVPGLTLGEDYYFWVSASICSTASQLTGSVIGSSALPEISGVAASDGDFENRVRVTWGVAAAAPSSYEIWRSPTFSTASAVQVGTASSSDTAFDDFLVQWETYHYWVRARFGANLGPFGTSNSGFRLLPAPDNVTASDGLYADRVQVYWNTVVDGATSYQVWRGGPGGSTLLNGSVTGIVYDDHSAIPDQVYAYQVRASRGTLVSAPSLSDDGWLFVPVVTELDPGLVGAASGRLEWADFDRDGLPDLVITGLDALSNPVTHLYRNTSTKGTTPSFSEVSAGLPNVDGGAWGDVDNDNDPDLYLSGFTGSSVVTGIWRNDSGSLVDGGFAMGSRLKARVAWGDVDNDGDQDLLATGYSGGFDTTLYLNEGESFTPSIQLFVGVSNGDVEFVDIDADRTLDAVVLGTTDDDLPSTRMYLNLGLGQFYDSGMVLTDLDLGDAAWGDMDSDGDPDLALCGYDPANTPTTKIYRNDAGSLVESGIMLEGIARCALSWIDVDTDGDVDLVAVGVGAAGRRSALYRMDGGVLTQTAAPFAALDNPSMSWMDADGDGDPDLMLMGGDTTGPITRYYRNESLSANAPPGPPTDLQFIGASGGTAHLYWSAPNDDHTPQAGLTYNLRVGTTPGGTDIVSPLARGDGVRFEAGPGNLGATTSWLLRGLPLVGQPLYWSIQAVDGAGVGSQFADEQMVILSDPSLIFGDGFESGDVGAWLP